MRTSCPYPGERRRGWRWREALVCVRRALKCFRIANRSVTRIVAGLADRDPARASSHDTTATASSNASNAAMTPAAIDWTKASVMAARTIQDRPRNIEFRNGGMLPRCRCVAVTPCVLVWERCRLTTGKRPIRDGEAVLASVVLSSRRRRRVELGATDRPGRRWDRESGPPHGSPYTRSGDARPRERQERHDVHVLTRLVGRRKSGNTATERDVKGEP